MPDKWSKDVDSKWKPPEGFFKGSADSIAKGLKSASDDLKQAMSRLNFYINRAGDNLSKEDKDKLEKAKDKLDSLYGEKKESFLSSNKSAKSYFLKEYNDEPTLPDMDKDFLKAYKKFSQGLTDLDWENPNDPDVNRFVQTVDKLFQDLEKKLVKKFGWKPV